MIKEYLKSLKSKGNFSWNDLSRLSGLPEVTIRKIFSGETVDPRFETVAKLVRAMGGSLDKVNEIEEIEKGEDLTPEAVLTVKELYEERIKEIKASSADHIRSLKRDNKILTIAVWILSAFLIGALILDIFIGSVGWLRY